MSRIIKQIEIENQPAIAIFDTGATYTYCRSSLVSGTPRIVITSPVHVALGGRQIDIQELCLFQGKIEGLPFFTDAVPVDELGQADGYELDALIGALTMERWEIKLCPKTGTLSLEGLQRREFTEF
jgi:hypothetical protein